MVRVTGAVLGAGCRPYHSLMNAVRQGLLNLKYIYDIDLHRAQFLSREMYGEPGRAEGDLQKILRDDSLDCIFIMTPEKYHLEHVEKVLGTRASLFLEKPVATTPEDTLTIYRMLEQIGGARKKQVGFVLRYTPFYRKIRQILDSGRLGQITLIRASESLGFGHGVSFFRRWHRHVENTGGLLNEKCCHDLDILNWYIGAYPLKVSSFKNATLFPPQPQLPTHCSDCRIECAYRFDVNFPVGIHLTDDMRANPKKYDVDLCVYNSGHDIADRQSVMLFYENGVVATFAVNLVSGREEREIAIYGDRAMLKGHFQEGRIEVWDNRMQERCEVVPLEGDDKASGHGGGDDLIIRDFLEAVADPSRQPLAKIEDGIVGSMTAFAADLAADEDRTVYLTELLSEDLMKNLRIPAPVSF